MLRKSVKFLYMRRILQLALLCPLLLMPIPAKAGVPIPAANCLSGVGCCSAASMPALVQVFFSTTVEPWYLANMYPRIETALRNVASDIRNSILFATSAMGAMIDGQNMEQTLLAIQKQSTDTMQSMTVSDQICRFGTLTKSLANSEDRARIVQLGLAREMQARQLLQKNQNSGNEQATGRKLGRTADKIGRFQQFRSKFCDPTDSNGSLGIDGVCTGSVNTQYNRDIDVGRTLDAPLSLNIDFTGANTTARTTDEENIFALSSNLYAHNIALNIGPADFRIVATETSDAADSRAEKLLTFRSLAAKRSVAQNSFAALAAMKAAGPGGSTQYMQEIIRELGISNADDIIRSIGQNPSYYSQMDMLTRKLYQSPAFYANLVDSPANVARQQAAMEGVALMQDRDIYESLRRSEMLLSTILEIYVMAEQDQFKDKGTK